MKERPILFSAPMIRALLSGAKTKTRRIMKPQPQGNWSGPMPCAEWTCPYGAVSGRLWCRETFSHHVGADALKEPAYCDYRADQLSDDAAIRWTPSIFMPRWASRITLEITDVRVERLNDISTADAKAEGVTIGQRRAPSTYPPRRMSDIPMIDETPREAYQTLWESINGAGSWALNPYVWAISFRRVT